MYRLVFSLVLLSIEALPAYAAEIEILVRTRAKTGLQSATAQLRRDNQIIDERLIASNGRHEFRNVPQGNYTVRVRADGFLDSEVNVMVVRSNSHEIVQIELQTSDRPAASQTGVASVYDLSVPASARKEYEQGLKERSKDGCNKATPHFEKAISQFAEFADAHNEMGKCQQASSEFDLSERSFRKAIQYGSSIFPYINLADLLAVRGRHEDAGLLLKEGIAKFPAEGDLRFALARSLYDQGLMKDAEAAGLEAHARSHRSADVHILLAKIYLASQNQPAVVTQLKLYLSEDPKGPLAERVRQNLAEVERK